MGIARNLTHIAVGQKSHLTAYEEYRERADLDSASAASVRDFLRAPVTAKWSVSDEQVALVAEDGTLSALKPGRVTLKSSWEGREASTTVEIVKALPMGPLPQISARASRCAPQGVALSMTAERALRFTLSFNDDCADISLEASAPDKPLPWEFSFNGGTLELTNAQGAVVSGRARMNVGGEVEFKVWADGEGSFPLSLRNKTVLLVGDSMAEGVGPWLQKKVESVGGRFINGQERSSTIVWWQGSGKLREELMRYQPDVVFIALGSNEIFLDKPELRAPLIKQMVEEIGARSSYWIGPPSWKPDTGLVRVIEENFQPGHFYNSNDLKVPRAHDGKHPTAQGYETWTDLVWNWYARAL
ncbi:MAG TPA: SGNH/GDSL hydrolase family protein [Pyrinomonadaceae bacterium]|nr:SGNH/GDSL hydrolase family protein [Pyrinomonadaceae bacterium]